MIRALAWRLALAAIAWWALAEGAVPRGPGAVVAAAAVLGGAAASLALRRPGARPARLRRLPRFLAFAVGRSVAGGIDVAARALRPRGAVRPGVVVVDCALPEGTPRSLHLGIVSLMPGTLVVEEVVRGGELRVHVIDTGLPIEREIARVEREIAILFGLR